jgi:hypothetical protein
MNQSTLGTERALWHAPKLQELGNLRDFVRTGHASGKSGTFGDGQANCGGEAMNQDGTCPPTPRP